MPPAHIVLFLQAIHRSHELQVRQRGPRKWDRRGRTGHNRHSFVISMEATGLDPGLRPKPGELA